MNKLTTTDFIIAVLIGLIVFVFGGFLIGFISAFIGLTAGTIDVLSYAATVVLPIYYLLKRSGKI